MIEVVKAIEKLSEKTIVDYLLIIVPIIISIIAIFISINTAHKQNKIALFEKRYYTLSQIKLMISFSYSVFDAEDRAVILPLFDSFFGTNLKDKSDEAVFAQAGARIELLRHDIMQAKFLFRNCKVNLEDIVNQLKSFLLSVALDLEYAKFQDSFYNMCKDFHEKDFRKMVKAARLK